MFCAFCSRSKCTNSKMQIVLFNLCTFVICCQFSLVWTEEADSRYSAGKDKYEAIRKEAKMPKYGPCWTEALEKIESGCKDLTDDMQHHMALLFTNCFLLKTGRKNYPCDSDQPIEECTRDMTAEAYNTYTEFFTHTQNICFFLQSQVWQAKTENTITRLKDSSETVAKQIEDSSEIQTELIRQQNKSIENQHKLIEHGSQLRQTIKESKTDVNRMLLEFKSSTSEQKQLIFEVFDRVNVLQNLVMGEFTGFYSLIFYAVSILICYLLTSTPRTSGARFWLFVLMTVNMVMERTLVMWGVHHNIDQEGHIIDENTVIYNRLALCRKVFTLFAVSIWGWFAYTYKDINQVNHKLLMDIQKQNSELKHLLQGQRVATKEISNAVCITQADQGVKSDRDHNDTSHIDGSLSHNRPNRQITCGSGGMKPSVSNTQLARVSSALDRTDDILPNLEQSMHEYSISHVDSTHTGYDSDSDFESDSSTNSALTDRTFTCDLDDSRSNISSSFFTSRSHRSSRESTPAIWDDDNDDGGVRDELREELRVLRESSVFREMTPIHGADTSHRSEASTLSVLDASGSSAATTVQSPRRGPGRPKGGRRSAPSPMSPSPARYNLRSRRGLSNIEENPIVESESVENFAKTVKHLAQLAFRNRVKAMASVTRSPGRRSAPATIDTGSNFFSSDDDV